MKQQRTKTGMKQRFFFALAMLMIFSLTLTGQTYTYRYINGWPKDVNERLQSFLNSTITMKERKVAAFDCDGTLFGQTPYYLADEALYSYAKTHYEGKTDANSVEKMKIVDELLHGDNVGLPYVKNRIKFLAGLTDDEVRRMGEDVFHEKYQTKFYPEMKELLANLKDYNFEVWVITASPELLYEQFVSEELGIPNDRILGVKSWITSEGTVTDQLIFPVPQDEGKADVIRTFIKTKPLLIGGNSRGDMEMMNEGYAMKLMVNPDNSKIEGESGGQMKGNTAKGYWEKDPMALIVYCDDQPEPDYRNRSIQYKYVTQEYGVKANKTNIKPTK